jgi:dipeptidyl aminopeptidase/acylaminoacyl peptidase
MRCLWRTVCVAFGVVLVAAIGVVLLKVWLDIDSSTYFRINPAHPPVVREPSRVLLRLAPDPSNEWFDSRVSFSANRMTIASSRPGTKTSEYGQDTQMTTVITLIDAEPNAESARFEVPYEERCAMAFSPDGKHLAIAHLAEVTLHDATTGAKRAALKSQSAAIFQRLVFSPDGQSLAALGHGLAVWDLPSGDERFAAPVNTRRANCVVFSPDGQRLAAAAEGPVVNLGTGLPSWLGTSVACGADGGRTYIWNRQTGTHDSPMKHRGEDFAVAFSPDGHTLAFGGASGVWLRDSDSGVEQRVLSRPVRCVAYSKDGRLLAIGLEDETGSSPDDVVWLCDTSSREARFVLRAAAGTPRWLEFAPGGHSLVAGCSLGIVMWDLRN